MPSTPREGHHREFIGCRYDPEDIRSVPDSEVLVVQEHITPLAEQASMVFLQEGLGLLGAELQLSLLSPKNDIAASQSLTDNCRAAGENAQQRAKSASVRQSESWIGCLAARGKT